MEDKISKREAIFIKVNKKIREQIEWEYHRNVCLEAGICPNCGKDIGSNHSIYYYNCECGYSYSNISGETGITIE